MRRKNPSRFPIPVKVGLKEATAAVASFALSFVQIGKREGFFRRMWTPAFLKITFQLHRNPTVLLVHVQVLQNKLPGYV